MIFMEILTYLFGFIFSLFAAAFLYYSIQNVRLMKGSMGRLIMAFGAILFIFAIIVTAIDTFIFPSYRTFINSLLIWVLALFTYAYGVFLVIQGVRKIYRVSILRLMWEHQGSIYNLIGIFAFAGIGLPIYIVDMRNHITGNFTWLTFLFNLIQTICFANLAFAAKIHNGASIKPQKNYKESISLKSSEAFIVKIYSALTNTFLSVIKISGSSFKQLLLEFFEFNPILFDGCIVNQDNSIDFSKTFSNIENIFIDNRIQNICTNFSALILKLFRLYSTMTSPKFAEEALSESYKAVRRDYGTSPLFFDILMSLPSGVLENEKIALLPREELESIVQERTKELEESRNYINNVIKNMMDMLIVVDPEGRIMNINKITEEILGYGEEELIGQPISLIFPSCEISVVGNSQFNKLFENESIRNLEMICLSKEEKDIPVLFSGSIMRNEYDEIIGIVCVAQDITGLKNAEMTLRESEERHRSLIQSANEGIMVIQDRNLRLINQKATDIFGYSEGNISLKALLSKILPDDKKNLLLNLQESLAGKEIHHYQFRIMDTQKNIRWVESSAIKIKWKSEPASLIFINDITERRKMEEELSKIQKLESLGILAGGIAHDFNNLLQGIMGNISLAQALANPDDMVNGMLAEADKACEQAKNLTQQLLTFSKGGEPVLSLIPLGDLIKDSVNFGLLGSNAKCELYIPDELWNAEVDKGQINQVFNNIIINAKQAMIDGGIIKVIARNITIGENNELSLKSGHYVRIDIKDQGIGISEEEIGKIFDPFFTTKRDGNGLGLSISYSIIKRHHGAIRVKSTPGLGSIFTIYIPAKINEFAKKVIINENNKHNVSKGEKILIMDDEKIVRDLAYTMLSSMGYNIVLSEDGYEAIDKYRIAKQVDKPFDAVIMDLTIPGGMGGKEAIYRLKEIDPGVKAIVSSGYSNDPVMSNFTEYGFRGILAKPYKIEELTDALSKVLAE